MVAVNLFYAEYGPTIPSGREVNMANEHERPDPDEPTEEEIEEEQKRSTPTWKHDNSRELSERDEERPLKP